MQEDHKIKSTVLYESHVSAGARMVEFAGYLMPVQYKGIISEHLATRRSAGIFDVSHMGRFVIAGSGSLDFLRCVLTNDASLLAVGRSQYTMIPNQSGGAIDDAYLYRFVEDEYLLVVNASNRSKDWAHLVSNSAGFDVNLTDISEDVAMIALQGPESQSMLQSLISCGSLPENKRNACGICEIGGCVCKVARTGYTGEKVCFEIFAPSGYAQKIWNMLVNACGEPVGLGARDTLRLEAGLPLYGHELGVDMNGDEIPIFACPLAKFAVLLSESRGDFIGREQLEKQASGGTSRKIRKIEIADKGLAREGAEIFHSRQKVGYVTSGNMIPVWKGETHELKAMCLGYVPAEVQPGTQVELIVRGKPLKAIIKA